MSLPLLALGFIILLSLAYRLYGGWVAKQFGLNDANVTPAHKVNDGVDYVPTRPFYLFAQHFSAIAAAGPIVGPILACQAWGWLPCLVWIALGVVLIGAVHDFSSLAASVRHGGNSIAEITRERLGKEAGLAIMAFIWIALLYVIVAFTYTTAGAFASGTEELQAANVTFDRGGAVAAASVFYLLLAIVMGLVQRFLKPPLWLVTLIFVPATLALSWCGTYASDWFNFGVKEWGLLVLAYCGVASVVPVWMLLQPRGYLGGFVLYFALAIGVIGIFFGDLTVQQDSFKGWNTGKANGLLFPFLFVTIACGACSGFHGLVCSGTTSKQVDRESHIHPVGYGAMLAEGFVALIALVTFMVALPGEVVAGDGKTPLSPGVIYANGIAKFMLVFMDESYLNIAKVFGAMVFSTFVFDTLDVSTRLARYMLQELTGWKTRAGAVVATLITLVLPVAVLLLGSANGWRSYWTLFGASNQLLAALTLLSITVWLYQAGKRVWFTLAPMIFVLVITLWSLAGIGISALSNKGATTVDLIVGTTSFILIALALFLAIAGLVKLRNTPATSAV